MKYRLLSSEELKELEPEFINFLATNHITAQDWVKLKGENPEKVDKLIEIFSDIVMEKVLQKIEYLEVREEKSIMVFRFLEEKVSLAGITAKEVSDVDFTNPATVASLALKVDEGNLEVFKTEKPYFKSKPEEVFDLVKKGALVSDGKLFEAIVNPDMKS